MFWKFNVLTSHIDTLLEQEDVALREILDEDDVLQECKAQNSKLVQFLTRSEHIEDLVNMVIQQPDDETDDKSKYKYPNIACEVLTSEVPQITEHLANEEPLLSKVYSFLERDPPLNPLQASFFSKVMGLLIARKSQVMLEFLQSKEDFVGRLLQHLGTSAIMDMLLRLVTCMQSIECRLACVQWLNEQQIVQKLIGMIDPSQPEEKHSNAALALCDMVALSREHMSDMQERADPDPLLASIEAEENLCELLNHMLDGEKSESVLVNGLLVIQTLLEFRKISPEGGHEQMTALDAERLAQGVRNTLQSVIPRLKDLHQTLIEPAKQHYCPMTTTAGHLDPPLGNARLQLVRLIASLLLTNTPALNSALVQLGTLNTVLDLLFKYMWNNFLHTQVESCICTILANSPHELEGDEDGKLAHPLLTQLFIECKILQRILDAWEDNKLQQNRPGGRRRGYMGHLTRIANSINEHKEKGPNADKIKELFQELDEDVRERWETFSLGSLADQNKTNTVDLVGSQLQSSSEDDDADFRDIPFPQETAMQQARRKARLAYSEYQTQAMTSSFIDQYGYKEDEFTEQEERVDAPFSDRISSINFDITVEDNSTSASLFEQACNERMQQFDDLDDEDELWETKELGTFTKSTPTTSTNTARANKAAHKPRQPALGTSDDSDSDEQTLSDEEDEDEAGVAGAGAGGDSDSEEDLQDSPQRIFQSPAVDVPPSPPTDAAATTDATATATDTSALEKMDVDATEASKDTTPHSEVLEEAMDSSSQGPMDMDTNEGSEEKAPGDDADKKVWGELQSPEAAEQKLGEDDDVKMDDVKMEATPQAEQASSDQSSEEMFTMELEPESPSAEAVASEESKPEPPSQPRTAWTEPSSPDAQTPAQQDSETKSDVSQEASPNVPKDDAQLEDVDDEDDLAGNFNFLKSSGMFGGEKEGENATEDANKSNIEKLRQEAKEAMQEFTSTTTPTPATTSETPEQPASPDNTTENGPV